MRTIGFFVLALLAACSAQAQEVAQTNKVDPRLSQQAIAAYQAMLGLREAEFAAAAADAKAAQEAYEARLETAMEWLRQAQGKPLASKETK